MKRSELWVYGIVTAMMLSAGRVRADDEQRPGHPQIPSVTVRGEAEVSAPPDRAVVQLGAETQSETAAVAQNQINSVMKAVLEEVRKAGVPNAALQTSNLELTPVYSNPRPDGTEQRIVAYRASNVVRVQLDDLSLVGKVIDAGLHAGANRVQGISFTLKNQGPTQAEALDQAVHEARTKADAIARALGQRLGPVLEVIEEGARVRPPVPMMAMRVASSPTPVESGQVEVQGSVTVRYALIAGAGTPGSNEAPGK